jgi:hypothetical protein
VAATGIIKEWSGEGLPPVFEHRLQSAALEVRRDDILERIDDSQTGDRARNQQITRGARPND